MKLFPVRAASDPEPMTEQDIADWGGVIDAKVQRQRPRAQDAGERDQRRRGCPGRHQGAQGAEVNAVPGGPLTEFFWVITLQRPGGADTVTGTSAVPASCTRRDAYEGVTAAARRRLGIPPGEDAVVLFYSLEPMALADGRQS